MKISLSVFVVTNSGVTFIASTGVEFFKKSVSHDAVLCGKCVLILSHTSLVSASYFSGS